MAVALLQHSVHCRRIYTDVRHHDVKAVYAPLLRQCSRYKALAEGRKIHSILQKTEHDRQTFLGNLLVHMYGSCGEVRQARMVFDNILEQNGFSWNLMLGAYVQNGYLEEAKALFKLMPEMDVIAWNAMIVAYARVGQLQEARRLFDEMSIRDIISWNTIVAAYAQNGHMDQARSLFDLMPHRSVVSFNSMITGYAQNNCLQEARKVFDGMLEKDVVSWTAMIVANAKEGVCSEAVGLFQKMDIEGIYPNMFTFTSVIDACGGMEDRNGKLVGELVHRDVITMGLQREVNVGNALVNMYARFGELARAKELFDGMKQRDVISWTSISAAYAEVGDFNQAMEVYVKTPQRDVVSWTSLLGAFSQHGRLDEAEKLFRSIPYRNVVTWNTMINAYAQNGHGKLALKLFKLMDLEGIRMDRVTYIVALEACTSMASLPNGRLVHSSMVEAGVLLDVEITTSLIHLYGKCGSLKIARNLFDRMPRAEVVPWNVMITVYAQSGHTQPTIELFRTMLQEGVPPNEITSVGVISACSHAGTLKDGRYYFMSFVADFGMRPVIDHYICMIDLLGRAGLLGDAEDLVENMPFESDELVWLALLSACKLHGDVKRASRVAEQAVHQGKATPSAYVLLSNVFTNKPRSMIN